MDQRRIGTRQVSALGYGCMTLSSTYRDIAEDDAVALVNHAIDRGISHFDTSDAYGWGHNERLLSRVMTHRRDEVHIATKFGQLMEDGKRIVRGTPDYVRRCCDASLERLGIDQIDLYYIHRVDPDVPVEETVGAMAELVDAGKVAAIGISEAAPETIRRAHDTHPIAAMQVEFSLWTRFAEEAHFDLCEELGIAYVAYSPIGRGFLSGTIKGVGDLDEGDRRRDHPRFSEDNIARNIDLLQALNDVAVGHGVSPTQVALAWVLAQRPFIVPIPGTTTTAHLDENIDAAAVTLTDDDLARLAEVFVQDAASGDRYPAGALAKVQI